MSYLCGTGCEKSVEAFFIELVYIKINTVIIKFFLTLIMFTQYNQFCVLKFFI